MKHSLFKKAAVSLSIIASLTACAKEKAHNFEEEHKYGEWTIFVTLDDYNEKILIKFETKEEGAVVPFKFYYSFSYTNKKGAEEIITNQNDMVMQFVYRLSDGTAIEFDEEGFYSFSTDTKINIWYNYADRDIKEAIKARNFQINFGAGTYVPDKNAK